MANEQSGIDFLLYINTAPSGSPVWTAIGGQRNATLRRINETVDASHKLSGAWKTRIPGPKDWSISAPAVSISGDAGQAALNAAYDGSDLVQVQLQFPGNLIQYTGFATIADLSLDTNYTDAAIYSVELQGAGALTKTP